MRTSETTDWNVLLAFTDASGQFRNLLRSNGAQYARRLARKALRYRGYDVV